jgi:predicted alpha/beta hydrolase
VFVPLAFALLVAAHLFDLASFVVMTDMHGLGAEANPIVVFLHQEIGLPGLTVLKVAAVAFGGTVFALIAPHRRRLATAVIVYGIAAGMVGGLSNVATIYAY